MLTLVIDRPGQIREQPGIIQKPALSKNGQRQGETAAEILAETIGAHKEKTYFASNVLVQTSTTREQKGTRPEPGALLSYG